MREVVVKAQHAENGMCSLIKCRRCMQQLGAVGFLTLLAVGCGGEDFATVNGTVEYEESPVPAGTKVFFELPGSGYVAAAKIDEQSAFKLAYKGSPKLRIGEYSVFFGPPESNLSQEEFYKLKKRVDAEYRKQGKRPPPSPDWILPEKYYSPNTTTLKESVVAGTNEIKIVLED